MTDGLRETCIPYVQHPSTFASHEQLARIGVRFFTVEDGGEGVGGIHDLLTKIFKLRRRSDPGQGAIYPAHVGNLGPVAPNAPANIDLHQQRGA